MDNTLEPSFQEQKQQALIRRTDKLIGWLARPDYAQYIDTTSTEHLFKLIDLVIWALERSIPLSEWRPFLRKFRKARKALIGLPDDGEKENIDEKTRYFEAIAILLKTLQGYKDYMKAKAI